MSAPRRNLLAVLGAAFAFLLCLLPVDATLAGSHGLNVVGPSTYEGLATTRGSAPSGHDTRTQAMARTALFVPSGFHQIKFTIPNWFGPEAAPGSAATTTASIETSPGVCTTLKKSGSSTITLPDGGQVDTDYAIVTVAGPTWIWWRQWINNPSGVVLDAYQGQNLALGDALILGSSVTDQTVSCDPVVDGGTFQSLAPLAGIAPTIQPSVCGYGDSIMIGVDNDHTPNSNGDNGIVMPVIGPLFGYSNMGVNGDLASQFVSGHTNRVAVGQHCSHWIVEYGTNDFSFGGSSVAALQADLTTIYGYAPVGTVIFQNALIARTCSTDFWATVANQAPEGTGSCNLSSNFESKRVTFDASLTSATFGPNGGYFDPTSVVGTGTNNSIWKAGNPGFAPCVPNWTNDGAHPDTCSYYSVIQSSGYLDPTRIHR